MSNYDIELDMNTRNSLSLIINRIAKNSTVLEFGPANGRMTKHLKETLGCTVYAVELDKDAAKDAAEFCEDILVGDIESFKWLKKYQDIEFDYIIFADVLEHLYNPEMVLTKAKTLLKDEGSILMSLPNIAHNAIIMDLINDKFTYRKTGLLDNTHIRFFTKNTLEELITSSGLQIAFETASYAEPSNTEFKNNYSDLDSSTALLLSGREFGEAYQFIFEAKNKATVLKTDFLQEDTASLYIDTGKGFNELEKVTTIFNSQSDNIINFTLGTDVHNVKVIRIDPLEMALSLKVENIIINGTDETNKLNHNGVTIGNNELKFLDNDPQLLIDFDEPVILKNIAVNYEYLTKNHTVKDEKIELQAIDISHLHQAVAERDEKGDALIQKLEEKENDITGLHQAVAERDEKGDALIQKLEEKENDITGLHQAVAERDEKRDALIQKLEEQVNDIAHLHQAVAERDKQISEVLKSTSWKFMRPMRAVKRNLKRAKLSYRLVSTAPFLIGKFLNEVKNNGVKSALRKAKQKVDFVSVKKNNEATECTFKKSGKDYEIKVSVIIPTYNRSALLPKILECWREVDKVTKYRYEIVFSDDGSEDGSIGILENEKNLPITIIRNDHGGAAKARNSAIRVAQGEKLFIIGDDIFPSPEIINQHYEKLQELPVCKAVLGEVIWHKDLETNTLMKHITELGNEQFSFGHFSHNNYTDFRHFYTCNISIDREFLLSEKIIFDESFYKVNFEDIELGYRLSKKGMEVFYYPDAVVQHYHPYKSVSDFCKRQQTAGEMALVFKRLHSEVEWVVQVEQILSQWNLTIKDVQNFEFEPTLDKVIELCQLVEDDRCISKFNLEKSISNMYKVLFRFYYEKGVVENSYTLEKNVVEKVFTKHFLPLILKNIQEIKAHLSLDIIDDILNSVSSQTKAKLIIEVNELQHIQKVKDCYKSFEKDILIRLKSDSKDYDSADYIYKPEGDFNLHPSNVRQIILFLQNNPNTDFVLLSFGLNDLPSIGLFGDLSNNVIYKNNGIALTDISSNKFSGKVIRLISEKYNEKKEVYKIVNKLKINNYGYWNESKKIKIESQVSHFNTTLHKKSGRKIIFVFPIFLAVGGAERNTIEIINQLKTEYDFVVVNFERLSESLGSLHHQFIDSCIGVYDLTELSSHDGILNYLKILENLYSPDLVWICNGSPWFESNLANIRNTFNNSAIVDQQVYDANEGWVRLYKEKNEALLSFDRFIAINSKIREVFTAQANLPTSKVDLIHHVVKAEQFNKDLYPKSLKIVDKFNIDLSKDNFIFVGRMSEQKRPFLFLEMVSEIAKNHTDVHFYMVGTGHLSDKVDDYIANKNLENIVSRIKHIDNVAEIYSLMKGLIITSKFEGLPIAMLEAMCMELPILATCVGDIDIVIEEYRSGLIVEVNSDAKTLANSFDLFYRELDSYKENASKASALVRSRFSENTVSSVYDISFKRAIEGRK